MMKQEVKTTYLEMNSADDFIPAHQFEDRIQLKKIEHSAYIGFILFAGVGLPWRWYSRLHWSPQEWEGYFAGTNTGTWLAFSGERLIGYFELEYQKNQNTEIKFIGLLPQYIGQGLGGMLLSHAVQQAWTNSTTRVWVHTCDNDAEAALKNYLSRGFSVYREEVNLEDVPDKTILTEKVAGFYRAYLDRYMP